LRAAGTLNKFLLNGVTSTPTPRSVTGGIIAVSSPPKLVLKEIATEVCSMTRAHLRAQAALVTLFLIEFRNINPFLVLNYHFNSIYRADAYTSSTASA